MKEPENKWNYDARNTDHDWSVNQRLKNKTRC